MPRAKTFMAIFWLILLSFSSCGSHNHLSGLSGSDTRFWPVSFPADEFLDQSHTLMPYMRAAAKRELPLRFFRELIERDASVSVVEGSWPSYRPGIFYGGTVIMPAAANPESWSRGDWASFYNELFHAWYGLVFLKGNEYVQMRAKLHTPERMNHYRRANPSNPELAQEEAWSETVATVMISPTAARGDFWQILCTSIQIPM